MEAVLQRRVLEFENERTSLQTRIQSMGEDLRAKAEIQEKVDQLQVNRCIFFLVIGSYRNFCSVRA